MSSFQGPEQLVEVLCRELRQQRETCPDRQTLIDLFEVLFYASLRTEEGEAIKCQFVYLDPKNPDPNPPKRIRSDRWTFTPFGQPIPFTAANVVKLAPASDSRSCFCVVHPDERGGLQIWGLVDQGSSYYDFVIHAAEQGAERAGLFDAGIVGVGHIQVSVDYKLVAELRGGELITGMQEVLYKGPVSDKLIPAIDSYIKTVRSTIIPTLDQRVDQYLNQSLAWRWIGSLSRLLIRTQGYRHGGAYLITPSPNLNALNIKYQLEYARFRDSLIHVGVAHAEFRHYFEELIKLKNEAQLPSVMVYDRIVTEHERDDCREELEGSIWLTSLLSRVDGLVLLDSNLTVLGFGVEITETKIPEKIAVASNASGSPKLQQLEYEHFGTRHRSMFRYCAQDAAAVGFVISQDGDIRAITKVGDQIVVWNNLLLRLDHPIESTPEPQPIDSFAEDESESK